jgi:hypothetical protein
VNDEEQGNRRILLIAHGQREHALDLFTTRFRSPLDNAMLTEGKLRNLRVDVR